ncbi:hypothetical protein O0L34_g9313 [Tuta absoluta]|nr:hypothetical protein O0L34_g9313 [Tuta absoluta]
MEDVEIARSPCADTKNRKIAIADRDKESVDNFQKFFYELFEKNGILNDLRAYLRRHIVDVLKNSNAGETPLSQKHFSERLELKAQALNILVAEYLLQSDFHYTLSVFVSEIPLANMVFDFAGSLMKGEGVAGLRFKDKDVWSIIQHLGIKCDSKQICRILDLYKNENQPLLLCIIKGLQLVDAPCIETPCMEPAMSDEAISERSSETLSESNKKLKCHHLALCKACNRLREKYKKRKESEKMKETSVMSATINSLMKKIGNIEGNLVNEMFDQLKTVYETELEMMRSKQERRVQQAIQEHAQTMQQQRQELEDAYKAREENLERGVRAKKKFLWGLARTLRTQHDQLARAMIAVKYHTQRLKVKEENLMSQLSEVEHLMQNRDQSQDMQVEITSELTNLQKQLDLVKRERESVNREKTELEHLKQEMTSHHADIDIDEIEAVSDTAWSNYDILKKELTILRKLNDSPTEYKRISEQSTEQGVNRSATSISRSAEVLNNDKDVKMVREEDKLKNTQVVNDFKKQKNVNFNVPQDIPEHESFAERHCPVEEPRRPEDDALEQLALENERLRELTRQHKMFAGRHCPVEEPRPEDDALEQLTKENERLRELARQQQQELAQLGDRMAQLEAKLNENAANRLRDVSPSTPPTQLEIPRINNTSVPEPPTSQMGGNGWRCCGGGEETALLKLQPRVFVPGDNVPFIGIVHDRHEPKRLMNQWRCARRASPLRSRRASPPRPSSHEDTTHDDQPAPQTMQFNEPFNQHDGANLESHSPNVQPTLPSPVPPTTPQSGGHTRVKSPKSLLREAKEKLRTCYPNIPISRDDTSGSKSPSTVLREAKQRLRKLEIEAEAVEKSYMDYRKRQNEIKERDSMPEEAVVTKDVDGRAPKIVNWNLPNQQNSNKGEISLFLQGYRQKLNSDNAPQFPIKTTTAKTKPIPEIFSPINEKGGKKSPTENYVEAPMTEFQKFYKTSGSFIRSRSAEAERSTRRLKESTSLSPPRIESPTRHDQRFIGDSLTNDIKQLEAKTEAMNKEKSSKKFELEILKQNIHQMYLLDTKNKEENQDGKENNPPMVQQVNDNIMRVEVENINDTNEMRIEAEPQEVIVVVESSIDEDLSNVEKCKKLRGNMTILISPKRSDRSMQPRSPSPEKAANLTKNDVLEAIFQADPAKVTSADEVDDAGDKVDGSDGELDDYPDDFSADVDNYDSNSNEGTPVSRDDVGWDDSQTYP